MEIEKISRVNTTTVFLLPLIPLDKGIFDLLIPYKGKSTRLLNAYLYDEDVDKYKTNHISVVHRNHQDKGFELFENSLTRSSYFVDSYDIAESQYSVKVFKIPENKLTTYNRFLKGKYSEYYFDDIIDVLHFDYLGNKDFVTQVFRKDPELKARKEQALGVCLDGLELWSIYDNKYDILTRDIKSFLCSKKLTPNTEFLNT